MSDSLQNPANSALVLFSGGQDSATCLAWALADDLGGPALVDLIVEASHTCYRGDRDHRQAWGYGCGDCPACELRAVGYGEWVARP